MTAPNTSKTPAPAKAGATQTTQAPAKGKAKLSQAELDAREAARKAETPAARFARVVRPRIGKVLDAMRLLETVGKNYDYTPEQANKVLEHLVNGVSRVKVAFSPAVRRSRAAQELPDI